VDSGETRAAAPAVISVTLNWVVLLLLVVIWGSAFAAIKIGVETIDPVWMVTGRMLLAALVLGVWILGEQALRRPRQRAQATTDWRSALVWYGFIGVVFTAMPFVMFAIAAKSVSSAVLAICNGGTPFFTAIMAHIVVAAEKLTVRRVVGVALGFAGLLVLVEPELQKGASAAFWGLILAIAGAALYAGSNVATRKAPVLSPAMSSFLMVLTGGVAMLVAAPLLAPFPAAPSLASISAMIFLALLPTGVGFILFVWLIRQAGSVFTSFTTYLSPLWATGVGVLFLHEPLQWSMLAAMALIFAGVAIANQAARKRV
jgi:drug/metabolite transporter (DMT)-like permease